MGADLSVHYLQCQSAQKDGTKYGRKDRLIAHLRIKHTSVTNPSQVAETGKYTIDSEWPRQCGFCGEMFETLNERMDHIARKHFEEEGLDMSAWKLPFPRSKDDRPGFNPHSKDDDDDDSDNDLGGSGGPSVHNGGDTLRKSPTSSSSSHQNTSKGSRCQGSSPHGYTKRRHDLSQRCFHSEEEPGCPGDSNTHEPTTNGVCFQCNKLKGISAAQPSIFNPDHRIKIGSDATSECFSQPMAREHPLYCNLPAYASPFLSATWPEGPEKEELNTSQNHSVNTYLPLSPGAGLNEVQHRRTASFNSDISYPMQRFLGERLDFSPQFYTRTTEHTASNAKHLKQDPHIQASKEVYTGTKGSKSSSAEVASFSGWVVDPSSGTGAWTGHTGAVEEDAQSSIPHDQQRVLAGLSSPGMYLTQLFDSRQ
jgi:hypothetical protein